MRISTDKKYINVFKALASEVRLDIIELLAKQPMNIKDIAAATGLSSAIITMHIKKLEEADIIRCETVNLNGGRQKLCILDTHQINVLFPKNKADEGMYHKFSMPVGHFTDFSAKPTCGLASSEKIIGQFDEVRSFMEPERMQAQILWISEGFVEYTIPNYLVKGQTAVSFTASMEIGSEFPGVNENWPSEITFFVNGINVGSWISPGDFGCKRGKLNPEWWADSLNQYGLLKVFNITEDGTFIDGKRISDISINDVGIDSETEGIKLKIGVAENTRYKGGLTIYGNGFGNYEQDIVTRIYYKDE